MSLCSALPAFAPADAEALPLWLVRPGAEGADLPAEIGVPARTWARAQGFAGKPGQICLLPDSDGALAGALYGIGAAGAPSRDRWLLAKTAETLPAGDWRLAIVPEGVDATLGALGWLLAQYRFARYKQAEPPAARLVAPQGVDADRVLAMAAGEFLARDLINTPASDMGPEDLEHAARALAERHGATISVIRGEELLAQNFPMIHAVGRAGAQAPRLIDLRFAGTGPAMTLVGKGVCFDTGGLNLKPSSGMQLMKKDMGGAATVMGLAQMIMELNLPLRLRVIVPAVENSVSGRAMRPKDILKSRKGLTVEVNDTDAEGRLVLADALAWACEESPEVLISMATLTGAARVAVGPDLAPYYTDDATMAEALEDGARAGADPVWRLPFHDAYESVIEPGIADLDNAPGYGFAGSITAALFLRRFADHPRYMHFDIYGHTPSDAPARPKGGVGQGARALLLALPQMLGL